MILFYILFGLTGLALLPRLASISLGSSNSPALASRVAGTIGAGHEACLAKKFSALTSMDQVFYALGNISQGVGTPPSSIPEEVVLGGPAPLSSPRQACLVLEEPRAGILLACPSSLFLEGCFSASSRV